MHDTAEAIGGEFLRKYSRAGDTIVELGAYDVNGTIRAHAHPRACYIGLDISVGPGVDVVVKQGEALPIASGAVDIVLATSVLEHDAFFWETFVEMGRVLKPGGVIYINAPSNGSFHRYPTDNWRFYPDAGKMLEKWALRNRQDVLLIESFLAERRADQWNDFAAVFQRAPVSRFHEFLSDSFPCTNVWRFGADEPARLRENSEDMMLIASLQDQLRLARERNVQQQNAVDASQVRQPVDIIDSAHREEAEDDEILQQRRFVAYMRATSGDTRASTERLDSLLSARAARHNRLSCDAHRGVE